MNPALDSRARFEATFGTAPYNYYLRRYPDSSDFDHLAGRYVDALAQAAWEAWQAAIASRAAGWISVDDRLPEHHQDVIALYWPYNNKQNRQCTTGAVFDVNEGKFLDDADGDDLHWPSHWMPRPALPAPPTPQDPPIAALAAKETT